MINFINRAKFFTPTVALGLSQVFIGLIPTQVSALTFSIGNSTVNPATLTAPNPPGTFPAMNNFPIEVAFSITNTSAFKKQITNIAFDFVEVDSIFNDFILNATKPTLLKILPGETLNPVLTFPVSGALLNAQLGFTEGTLEFGVDDVKISAVLTTHPTLVPNPPMQTPRGGGLLASMASFDAGTGRLSFSGSVVDFLSLGGGESLDPIFASDPILGANIEITDFTLSESVGDGFLFENGTLTISNNEQTFLTATIPELLIDDTDLDSLGLNIFGLLAFTQIQGSTPFLSSYLDSLLNNLNNPPGLFARTSEPITSLIANGQSFTTTIESLSIAKSSLLISVPEPTSTFSLLTLGTLGAASTFKRKLKPFKPT